MKWFRMKQMLSCECWRETLLGRQISIHNLKDLGQLSGRSAGKTRPQGFLGFCCIQPYSLHGDRFLNHPEHGLHFGCERSGLVEDSFHRRMVHVNAIPDARLGMLCNPCMCDWL